MVIPIYIILLIVFSYLVSALGIFFFENCLFIEATHYIVHDWLVFSARNLLVLFFIFEFLFQRKGHMVVVQDKNIPTLDIESKIACFLMTSYTD